MESTAGMVEGQRGCSGQRRCGGRGVKSLFAHPWEFFAVPNRTALWRWSDKSSELMIVTRRL